MEAVQAAIRGPVGKKADIQVGRPPDYTPVKISLTRVEVPVPSVTYNLAPFDPTIGVIQVNIIAATGPDELRKAIADLKARGAVRFILDLRNNGGGLVEAGVDMARLFLKDDVVIQEQFRGEAVKTFKVDQPGEFADLAAGGGGQPKHRQRSGDPGRRAAKPTPRFAGWQPHLW